MVESNRRRRLSMMIYRCCLFVLLSAISSCTSAGSQTINSSSETSPKISPELLALYDEYSLRHKLKGKEPLSTKGALVRVIDGYVLVDAVASGDVNTLKADLIALGLRDGVSFDRLVSGQLPISSIPSLGELSSLRFARASAATVQEKPLSSTTPER
jgi:ABC-type Fe3+-hydroxamate transport system substrate-binding protein